MFDVLILTINKKGETPMSLRNDILNHSATHNLTKEVLCMSEKKDVVDRYWDVLLALKVLKVEMDAALKK